jgi:Ulp1 family protease
MGGDGMRHLKIVRQFLEEYGGLERVPDVDMSQFDLQTHGETSRQRGNVDCGVFVCKFVDRISLGEVIVSCLCDVYMLTARMRAFHLMTSLPFGNI